MLRQTTKAAGSIVVTKSEPTALVVGASTPIPAFSGNHVKTLLKYPHNDTIVNKKRLTSQ